MARSKKIMTAAEAELIGEIQGLTGRLFVYEDGWCGMVPFDGVLLELQTGPPVGFAEMGWREQVDVLREFTDWSRFPQRAWDDEYRIRDNIAGGKPPEQWLEGTSLHESFRALADGKTPPFPKQCPEWTEQDLADLQIALKKSAADKSVAKVEEKKPLQNASQETPQQEKKRKRKPRSRGMELG